MFYVCSRYNIIIENCKVLNLLLLLIYMKHRIFVAINLPEKVKKTLLNYQTKLPDFPIKWTKKENMHITLIFIGPVKDENIPKICEAVKRACAQYKSFKINLNEISYGPPQKLPPRMIWARGEQSDELVNLKTGLEKYLIESEVGFIEDNKKFHTHVTLGRIRTWEWKRIEPEERPEIVEETDLDFEVNSIEVMESTLKRTGAEYDQLLSVKLS